MKLEERPPVEEVVAAYRTVTKLIHMHEKNECDSDFFGLVEGRRQIEILLRYLYCGGDFEKMQKLITENN